MQVAGDGADTVVRDQSLADYEARLRKKDLLLPNPNATNLRGIGHGHVFQPEISDRDHLPLAEYFKSLGAPAGAAVS